MSQVSRDPSEYAPTDHAVDRHKTYSIDWSDAAETIREGELKDHHDDNCAVFTYDHDDYDHLLYAAVNYATADLITITFAKDAD